MDNNRTKILNGKKSLFYYNDIMNYIKNRNTNIPKKNQKQKSYTKQIIQKGTKQHTKAWKIQWKKHLPKINFEKIRQNTCKSYGQPFTKDLHSTLLHYSTQTNMYIHKYSRDNNPNCEYCRLAEDNLHLFIHCTRIKCGNNIKQYFKNWQDNTVLRNNTYSP